MLPLILNLTFLFLAVLIVLTGGGWIGQDKPRLDPFLRRFFVIVAGGFVLLIAGRVTLIIRDSDPRMARMREEADYYLTVLDRRADKGRILDRNGVVLAKDTLDANGRKVRVHPYGPVFAHAVGYTFPRGKLYSGLVRIGLERYYGYEVSGIGSAAEWRGGLRPVGKDVRLTLDARLQTVASAALHSRRGAVVALDPRNGDVLALVSSPSFDPDDIFRDDGSEFREALHDQSLVNRAVQGLYPPGSTFKVVVTAAALYAGVTGFTAVSTEEGFQIQGMWKSIREYHGHAYGKVGLEKGLRVSSNEYFAALGIRLGGEALKSQAERFQFNESVHWNSDEVLWPTPMSVFPQGTNGRLNIDEIAHAAIGQAGVLATPLQMALVAAAIANRGTMMAPRLERHHAPRSMGRAMSIETSRRLRLIMQTVVDDDEGTGNAARIEGLAVSGKTGTAQVDNAPDHAWFICMAPSADPRIAIAVIIENGGTGGVVAAPVAKEVLLEAKKGGYFD